MKLFRLTMLPLVVCVSALLILSLSAFTLAPNMAKISKPPTASHAIYQILPGQELTFSFPLKDDPGAMLHAKMSVKSNKLAGINFTSCWNNVSVSQWITNAFGGTLASYTIEIDFCYDGQHVLYVTDPPNDSWSTCCFWGMRSHNTYTNIYPHSAVAHGSFAFNGPISQSWSGWNQITAYGNGNYSSTLG